MTPGTRFGPYEILAPLGAGGMGEVYRARDAKLNRDVALKVLPDLFAADPDRLARFEREAHSLGALNHPNIAHVYGVIEDPPALVMELVEGEDLSQRIARGPIPLDEALTIATQIADALEAAHERGIIHRDLKPANIKIREDGTVKVLDFGLAKAVVQGFSPADGSSEGLHHETLMNSPTFASPAMTEMGMILGTAAYMAPEQAKGKPVDKRADIWAFGVVLFEMLTGRAAFSGDTATDVVAAVVTRDPDWTHLPPETPAPIRRLLRRCLEKDTRRRLRDIGEARILLDGPDAELVAASMAPVAPLWRRALPWAVAGAALVIAVASMWALSTRAAAPRAALARFMVAPPFGARRSVGQGFAASPDGQILAFSATTADGVSRIFTRRLDEPEAEPVHGSDNGVLPFWSPDSRSFAFTKDGGLYRVDLGSGAQRRLCDIPGAIDGPQFARSAGTWGTRGVIIFAAGGQGLFRVDEAGGIPTQLTSFDAARQEGVHASPSFLPDGRRVLFLALAPGQTRGTVYAVAIADGARTRVTESSGGAEYVHGLLLTTTAAPRRLVAQAFDPDQLTLDGPVLPLRHQLEFADIGGRPGFAVSPNGVLVIDPPARRVHRLTWMDRLGRVIGTVGPDARISDFALAPDETQVVARVTDLASLRADLWLFAGAGQAGRRLTYQLDTRRPLWSHDGRRVYFTSMPGYGLWSLNVGAAQPDPFAEAAAFSHFEDATRDGRYVVVKTGGQVGGIAIQQVSAPSARRVLVQGPQALAGARVSPDGRWLAYAAMLPGGTEIFVQPFDRPGAPQQVSRTGGIGPIWRADGRELYYEGPDVLMAAALTERAGALHAGTPSKLFAIHTQGFVNNQPHNVEVAANGQRFLVNAIVGDSDNATLEVTLNWAAGLKK